MQKHVLISVIINNFNYAQFLPQCIESALNQSYANKEVIVVDDGSTDGSREVIGHYGDRIKMIFKENGGQASALNAGFRHSTGELVIFLDSDDFLYEGAFERIAAAWSPGLSKIHWRLGKINDKGIQIGVIPKLKRPLSDGNVAKIQANRGPINPPTSGNSFSREFLLQTMPIPEEIFKICADAYLFARAPFYGNFAAIDDILGAYRIHAGNHYAGVKIMDLNKYRAGLKQAIYINQIIMEEAHRCGIEANRNVVYQNAGILKARLISFLLEPSSHPIPNESLAAILKIALAQMMKVNFLSRPRKAAEFLLLIIEVVVLFLKYPRKFLPKSF